MTLNQFIDTGADNTTVNDMKKSIAREEDLQKAMNKAGLVQKEVQVKGKNGQTFTRKQWVKASETQNSSTSGTKSPIKTDFSKLTSDSEAGTIAGEAHNMLVGYLQHNGVDAKDSKAVKKAAMELSKQYQSKANKKDAHPEDRKHSRKLSDEFSVIAGGIDKTEFSASNFKTLKENLADSGFKLDAADVAEITGGHIPDTVTLYKGKQEFTATFNKYSDGGCEVLGIKSVETFSEDSSKKSKSDATNSTSDQSTSSSGRFKSSNFQFRSGGQEIADIVNDADKEFGVKKYYNGNVGFGTLSLSNGEQVGFGYDKTGAYLLWQGQRFRSAGDLKAQWSGKKNNSANQGKFNHSTGTYDKPKPTMIEDYFAGNHSHEDGKKALAGLLGKGYTKEDIMAQAEKSGVTWKKNDHAGINWMRASMAIQKHLMSQQK